jgi:hypothetical protein
MPHISIRPPGGRIAFRGIINFMRLWSLHPRCLDRMGLLAVWREGLLAQQVLAGRTTGYRRHPQLVRFRMQPDPLAAIGGYLRPIHAEAVRRGYRFDGSKIRFHGACPKITVTRGQMEFEREHLLRKCRGRNRAWFLHLRRKKRLPPHPLFRVIPGGRADWEKG